MSNEDIKMVRLSEKTKERVKAISKRDLMPFALALDTILKHALPDYEAGELKLVPSVESSEAVGK